MKTLQTTLYPFLIATGCGTVEQPGVNVSVEHGATLRADNPENQRGPQNWAPNFPAQADLAILLDVLDSPVIDSRSRDARGDRFFPESWLRKVQEAYEPTDGDALEENTYEDWRLVSVRISPCAPIRSPQARYRPVVLPAVRLVWQPVIENLRSAWVLKFYADDRAVRHLSSEAEKSRRPDNRGAWREEVAAHLAAGLSPAASTRALSQDSGQSATHQPSRC